MKANCEFLVLVFQFRVESLSIWILRSNLLTDLSYAFLVRVLLWLLLVVAVGQ